ncbi:MAG: glycosyltransferase family 39 protein [Chitinophagaceae bacterium]|nr:glycosyltransferase family 39 protein [Chitinophagaceae bacterium]
MTFRKPDFLLLFIIFVGAILRFYAFPHIPFMYDEVSAWARTGFTNFHELINKGVKGDGHPAAIQVFLNYWRMIVGDSEAAFKIPFLVMGLLSVWLVFLIGEFWFNKTVGYLSAALVSCLQYTVMYSQIARPYMSGLFFSLMMVLCWTNYLFNKEEKHPLRQLCGFVVFATLCCYNHYFSLLFAFIAGVTGLFLIRKENWKAYLIANVIIVLLFLPHLSVSLFQFGIGGVGGWLPKPGPDFFRNYLNYIFHFSPWLKGLVIGLILTSIVFHSAHLKARYKFRIIALCWFLLPFFIGFYYSIYRNAVLQYSVLIFTFPYLLFFIFSWIKEVPLKYNWLMVSLILLTGIYTLVSGRKHFDIFYHQPIEELVENTINTMDMEKGIQCTVMMNEPRKYVGYYLRKYNREIAMDYWPEKEFQSYIAFGKYLSSLHSECFIAANVPTDYQMLIRQFYPNEISRDKGFTYQYHAFSKAKSNERLAPDIVFQQTLDMHHPGVNWKIDTNLVAVDSLTGHSVFHYKSNIEFGPTLMAPLSRLLSNGYNVVNISMKVSGVPPDNKASLVVSFDADGKSLFWQEKPFNYFLDSSESNGTVFYSISVRDLGFPVTEKMILNAYAWNKNQDDFSISDFNVTIDSGNPWIYGLIEPIEKHHP